MAVFKCKMCGGALELSGNETVVTCDYCDSVQTVSKKNDDVIANLFNRANNLRIKGEFDKAAEVYERIINEDNTDAEAYWGLVLCKYGIEYVEDPKTFKRIPTCHRTQYESILTDVDYKAAISNADSVSQGVYKTQAEEIANLQKDILAIVKNEKPFDVFICYKETDENGKRTVDSALANDIYYQLTQEGLKVFYAAITLEDKLGVEYEPYIFAALNSAKVMLVVGTKPEYFEAVWVKNEWSRYLKIMKTDRSKILIPCYRDMDAYDLPDEFSHLQAQDMSKIGFVNDVVRGIRKIITPDVPKTEKETVIVNQSTTGNAGALIKRAFMALEDGEWAKADTFFEQCLNQNAELAEAYLGKLMAEQNVRTRSGLANCGLPFDSSSNYQKAVRFGNEALVSELKGYIKHINERNEHNRLEGIYNQAIMAMSSATTEDMFKQAANIFRSIRGYKDSDKLAEKCIEKAEKIRLSTIYNNAAALMSQAETIIDFQRASSLLKQASGIFKSISGYKDSDKLAEDCLAKAEEKRIEAEHERELAKKIAKKSAKIIAIISAAIAALIGVIILVVSVIIPASRYNSALKLIEEGNYDQAIAIFTELGDYKDAKDKIPETKYLKALKLAEEGDYNQAIIIFAELDDYKDAEDKILETNYLKAVELAGKSDFVNAAIAYGKLGGYKDAREKSFELWNKIAVRDTVSVGDYHTVGIKSGGTVIAVGDNDSDQCKVRSWTDIVAIAADHHHTVGLKSDGTVVAVGSNINGECGIRNWAGIVAISVGFGHTVGLKSDGTVIAVGSNCNGECDVNDWTDIIAISAGRYHTVGLKSDGTVVATEYIDDTPNYSYDKYKGQCDVNGWTDIVAVAVGEYYTVGIKSDGTVVSTDIDSEVNYWTDIVAVSAGGGRTVGLKSDGTVVAVGDNFYGQCDVSGWTDIVAVSAGGWHTVGLKSDGTVVAVGDNDEGKCDVSGWTDIKQPNK